MKEKIMDIKTKIKPWHMWTVAIIVFLAIALFSIMGMTKTTYEVLYTGLSTSDQTAIEQYLSKENIDYQKDKSGNIEVQKSETAKVKMELASVGLPGQTDPGFELFDTSSLGLTQDERDVKYQRALKGELEKDLVNGVDGVEKANVTFQEASDGNIFTSSQQDAKATVNLGLDPGVTLNDKQIKGIQNLVAAGIKGMDPNKVVIVDDKGGLISDDGTNSSSNDGQTSNLQTQTEDRVKNDILKELSSVFGYDNVKVTVRAKMNTDEVVQNIEKYDPTGTLVSKHTDAEKSNTNDTGTTEPGTSSNGSVTEYQTQSSNQGATTATSKDENIENYDVGKTVETIKKNPGVDYLSVSVAVDQTLTNGEIKAIEQNVAVAAGLIPPDNNGIYTNGQVIVTPFVFKQSQTSAATTAKKSTTDNNLIAELIVIGAAALLVIFGVVFFILSARKRKQERIREEERIQTEINRNKAKEQEIIKNMNNGQEEYEVNSSRNREDLSKEATDAVEENPRRTAEYINKLINEG